MFCLKKTVLSSLILASTFTASAMAENTQLDLKFAGALEFSDTGTMFVGDNYNGAIYAFDLTESKAPKSVEPVFLTDIDARIASILGVGKSAIAINDMAVHPVTSDIYISVSRLGNFDSSPAIMKVTQNAQVELLDLDTIPHQKQALSHYPDQKTTFRPRGFGPTHPLDRDLAKGKVTLSSLAILDMEYYKGELFVSGVAFDNFLSTLRRMPYPFTGEQTAANVEMYHIAHDQFETRAPIRTMSVQEIDGKPQLVAAYTCSPIVLIGLDEIVDGAKISARTVMDYGNGQPIDMLSYTLNGEKSLFLTSNSRSPHVIPVNSLNGAKSYTKGDLPEGGKTDTHPLMPVGDTGKTVMFEGMSMHIDKLGGGRFVSLTRDMYTGSLNLDSNFDWFPNRIHNLQAEYDFPQYWAEKKQ
ncbi:hypothetical protein [Enterovibrio baiacu]|uniref:hypothetical protein n=1 Tax=Enterovibrio baiacu TaxID=2491023 RepID=UPI001012CA8D|nr:hypothetical protein [Enterovibrio baiacu]MBE1273409.1 hypothetical protein [Enterovibrio baiacu]